MSALEGKAILVLRPNDRLDEAEALLVSRGARPLPVPAIQIGPPPDAPTFRKELASLDRYDWVVFTSTSGVRSAFEHGADPASLQQVSVAAIGPGTAEALAEHGVSCDWMPERFTTEDFARTFPLSGSPALLLLRADVAGSEMEETLTGRGAMVKRVDAYTTASSGNEKVLQALRMKPDAILVTSASIATALNDAIRSTDEDLLSHTVLACIGPATARACEMLGLPVDVQAQVHTLEGLVEALEEHFSEPK